MAVVTKDMEYFMNLMEAGRLDEIVGDVFGVPFAGETIDGYADWNRQWLAKWMHPRFKTGYRGLIYQPMIELLDDLRSNGFEVYICTADEGAFLQLLSDELYAVPSEQVLGSAVKLRYQSDGTSSALSRTKEAHYLNNWDGKPRQIQRVLGKRPILAAGNSSGDLEMLQWVNDQQGPHLSLLVHHTDEEREYAYDKHTERVLPMARRDGWTVIDMKGDWESLFPSQDSWD